MSRGGSSTADIRPNHTIYVNNLSDRVKKDELRLSLYVLFSQFGRVVDVVALKTMKMRGQAFVVFKEIDSAAQSLRTMQGFPFYERPMRIQYSKHDSDVIAKMKGTFVERSKDSQKKAAANAEQQQVPGETKKEKKRRLESEVVSKKQQRLSEVQESAEGASEQPNKILFCANLPEETTAPMLEMLFNQFPGLKEVRAVENRHDIAFVEFEGAEQAGNAREALDNFKISPNQAMTVAFAKQ